MKNYTSNGEFHLVPFFIHLQNKSLILILFFLIYLYGIIWNGAVMLVVYFTTILHTPMYLFLSNLSFLDICYTTVTIPKVMSILLSGNNTMSSAECYTQLYLFVLMANMEIAILTSMAYDRYVAICDPLHYQSLMNMGKYCLILKVAWLSANLNSLLITLFASAISTCGSLDIHHFYCDVKALIKISCNDIRLQTAVYINTVCVGLFPFLLSLISYVKIFTVILRITSKEGRKKTYSTCSSHLIVLLIFYGTGVCVYIRPSNQNPETMEQVFSLLFTIGTPALNPLIYSLRNKDIKYALVKLLRIKSK